MIEIGDYLTLSDGIKYVVISRVNYNNKVYYALMDMNNKTNISYCYSDENAMVFINNNDVSEELLKLFYIESKKEIDKNN